MDALKNFSYSLVATAPSPASSGTSLVVTAGQGSRFPAVPFNAAIWPVGAIPTPANAEIVRVTNISTDTLTITRTQESTSARTVVVGDQIASVITAKVLTDLAGGPTFNGQIAFPASQNPSSDGNTLDDFERGTFTPTGNGITFSSALGRYIKIGRLVYASFNVTWPSTANGSNAQIKSFPFTMTSVGVDPPGAGFISYNSYGTYLTPYGTSNGTLVELLTVSGANVTNANLSTKQFVGEIIYEATT